MENLADEISNPDPYYLKSVVEFSDSSEVVSSEDIYSSNGIKLISKGTRFDKSFYERLVRYKLAKTTIDGYLTVKGAVTPGSLVADAIRMLDEDQMLGRMAEAITDKSLLRNGLSRIYLNGTLAFKLTLAREERPQLYKHGIRVALISLYLGSCIHLKPEELISLAAAAVFHDLGELHIDAALFDPDHQLTIAERRHIFSHPIITYLILKEFPEYRSHICNAVLNHHERLDGSGYPRNLDADKIDTLSQILAVAEVAGSLCEPGRQANACSRVEVILKLNAGQFRKDLVGYLTRVFMKDDLPNGLEIRALLDKVHAELDVLLKVLASWKAIYSAYDSTQSHEGMVYTQARLDSVEQGLFDIGLNSVEPNALTKGIEDDPNSLIELEHLVNETTWQLRGIINEIRRRWPELESDSDPATLALREWTHKTEKLLA